MEKIAVTGEVSNRAEAVTPSGEEVRAHLGRVLASRIFQRSPRQSAFLRYIVEKALEGEADGIKEYEIAVRVYGRPVDHSTRVDPIVRVEASRLRGKLLEYYANEGSGEGMRIDIPKGSYVPVFAGETEVRAPIAGRAPRPGKALLLAAGVAVMAGGLGWWGWRARGFTEEAGKRPMIPANSVVPASFAVTAFRNEGNSGAWREAAERFTEVLMGEMSLVSWPYWQRRTLVVKSDPSQGREQADAVVTGTVALRDGTLHVDGALEHVASRMVLWSGRFQESNVGNSEEARRLALERLAFEFAEAMNVALMERREQEVAAVVRARPEARRLWLEGDQLWIRSDTESLQHALALIRKSIGIDPEFGWAHASLAQAHLRAAEVGMGSVEEHLREAHREAALAMSLSPYLASVYTAQARLLLVGDWNIQGAQATCTDSLAKVGAAYTLRNVCGDVNSIMGDQDAALRLYKSNIYRRTRQENALTRTAMALYRGRKYEEARAYAERALEQAPAYGRARDLRALLAIAAGNPEEARSWLATQPADDSGRTACLLATALALEGNNEAAGVQLKRAERQLQPMDRAELIRPYLALGLGKRANEAIQEAMRRRDFRLLEMLQDPLVVRLDRGALFQQVRDRARL